MTYLSTTFPTPHTVLHEVYAGMGEDDMGNDVPTFEDPVERKAICWQPHWIETLEGHTSRVEADVDLLMPKVPVSLIDRFTLNGEVFETVGVKDFTTGPYQWEPGIVVELKRVTGG